MWAYDLDVWPWRSPRLSVIRVLVFCQSTKCKFRSVAHTGQTYHMTLLTLTFNLGGHGACRWCGSTSSICTPILKFLGLTVRKIWHICVSALVGLWPCPLTLKLVRNVARIMVPSCQFWWYYDYSFSIYGPLGQHGSDWSRDLVTLTFDFRGHGACGWCGSSSPSVYQDWSS